MPSFFRFLYTYQSFLTFLFIESFCLFLIVQYNGYQRSYFINEANNITGYVLNYSDNIKDYFRLKKTNQALIEENKKLQELLVEYKQRLSLTPSHDSIPFPLAKQYTLIAAHVISNSTHEFNNYLMISKGTNDGIYPGMSVISLTGVIGKVKTCSKHFSIVTSLLHRANMISTEVTSNHAFGIVKWSGENAEEATLLYLPKHLSFRTGDTVVTSGQNAIFPPGIPVGYIKEAKNLKDRPYYDITIRLSTDFSTLSHVYIIKNNLKKELHTLNQMSNDE